MSGKVFLVGAGPGDPGLLTLKAHEALKKADLIIYDYLANPETLRFAKKSAQTIGVGKGFRYKKWSQNRINRLVIRAAREGKTVLRLKGGDPYLFGRGGEEALYLHEHRIPFEVIPGVTSASGCAAYSGIPLTHRAHTPAVTFLTGHRADDKNLDSIAWDKIVALKGTLVVYMGFYNLAKITQKLIDAGLPKNTKVSVIQWGTLPRQKSCDGTLASIEKIVVQKRLGAPCVIIIGEVVALKNKLNWYEKLPLFGKKVLITRMSEKMSDLRFRLENLGAEGLEQPAIEIKPLTDYAPMDKAIQNISSYDWIIFTSTFGVDGFFNRLKTRHRKDARFLKNALVASVGPETSKALVAWGIEPDLQPSRFETSALVEAFKNKPSWIKGKEVLTLRTTIAPPFLEQGLKKLGGHVNRVDAYSTVGVKHMSPLIRSQLLKGEVDFIIFTSASTVEHWVKMLGMSTARKVAKKSKLISIGPVTSQKIKSCGLPVKAQAKIYTIDGIIDILKKGLK